jgi:hypothetical protein
MLALNPVILEPAANSHTKTSHIIHYLRKHHRCQNHNQRTTQQFVCQNPTA